MLRNFWITKKIEISVHGPHKLYVVRNEGKSTQYIIANFGTFKIRKLSLDLRSEWITLNRVKNSGFRILQEPGNVSKIVKFSETWWNLEMKFP